MKKIGRKGKKYRKWINGIGSLDKVPQFSFEATHFF
jgi:hypothetical protein